MAKQKGLIRIKGSLGDLTFYQKEGGDFVRKSSGVSKDKVLHDPAFQRTRENMSEFGAAAKAAKSFRNGFIQQAMRYGDKKLHNRIMKQMHAICKSGSGTRGKRSIQLLGNENQLLGFAFREGKGFNNVVLFDVAVTANANRNEVTCTIPDIVPQTNIQAPSNATHFKIELAIVSWSHKGYSTASKQYEDLAPSLAGIAADKTTSFIPLGAAAIGAVTTLNVPLPNTPTMTTNAALVAAIGITFYSLEGTVYYPLAGHSAMEIAGIF